MSSARAQPTHSLVCTYTQSTLLACRHANPRRRCHPRPHPACTRACHALLCPRLGGMRACTLPLAPSRRRLGDRSLDDDADQALKAAARSGLELYLKTPLPELSVDSDDDDD